MHWVWGEIQNTDDHAAYAPCVTWVVTNRLNFSMHSGFYYRVSHGLVGQDFIEACDRREV